MVWVVLTFLVAVLNLHLGYAVAVYLGYGPPTLRNAWEAFSATRMTAHGTREPPAASPKPAPARKQKSASRPGASASRKPRKPDSHSKPEGSLLDTLRLVIAKGESSMTALAGRLQDKRERASPQSIWSYVVELQEICESYMRQLEKAAAEFQHGDVELGATAAARERLEQTILQQLAQLETTASNLQHMDFDRDRREAGMRLLQEIDRMLAFGREIQGGLEAASPPGSAQKDYSTTG